MKEATKINGLSKNVFIKKTKIEDARKMYGEMGGEELPGMTKADMWEEMVSIVKEKETKPQLIPEPKSKPETEDATEVQPKTKNAGRGTKKTKSAKSNVATSKKKSKKTVDDAAEVVAKAKTIQTKAKKAKSIRDESTTNIENLFGTRNPLEIVLQEGVCYKVDSHCWWGKSSKVPKEMLNNAPKKILKGVQSLIDDIHIAPLNSVRQKGERIIIKHGFPFLGMRGVYYVPKTLVGATEEGLKECENEFVKERIHFMKNFPEYKKEWMQTCKNNNVPVPPEEWYPKMAELKSKFRFKWSIFSFTIPDQGLGILTEKQYKAEVEKQKINMAEFLSSTLTVMALKFEDLLTNLNTRLEAGETIKPKTLSSLRSFTETFDAMNVTGNKDLKDLVAKVNEVIGNKNAKDLNDSEKLRKSISTKVVKLMESVGTLIDTDVKFNRALDF